MLKLFNYAFLLLNSSFFLAVFGSFIWGIMSILLSPCHLTSIPLIIGFINKQEKVTTRKAFFMALLFSCGVFVSIALIGGITAFTGGIMGVTGLFGTALVAGVLIVFGLYLMEFIWLPDFSFFPAQIQQKGFIPAFVLGLMFGIGLGPCTFAFMAPVLAVAFQAGASHFLSGAGLVLSFALGHAGVIVLAGTLTEWTEHYLKWDRKSGKLKLIKRLSGFLVFLGGIYTVFKVF